MGTGDLGEGLTQDLGLPVDAEAIVARYLSRLDSALPLSGRDRRRIIVEAADALACAVETAVVQGNQPGAAARTAVAEFGDPAMLATQFAAALAPDKARRAGLTLVLTGPMVGLAWVASLGGGKGWTERIGTLLSGMPYVVAALVVAVPAAMLAVLGGWNRLPLKVSDRLVTTAAGVATLGCVAADTLLLTTAGGYLLSGNLNISVWPLIAGALSVVRLGGAATAALRLFLLRAAGC